MSTQQAPAPSITETSVIKHYKKQLIYRQHDLLPDDKDQSKLFNEVSNTKIYAFIESEKKNKIEPNNNNVRKIRRKRKNKNCRGQFRHEAMELIKLGSNSSHPLCKNKEPIGARLEKPPESSPYRDDRPQYKSDPNYRKLETPPRQPPHAHALPQMVPERRNSRELVPERRNSRELLPSKVPVIYRSPPEYCHYPLPPPYPHPSIPSYPVARSPPRPIRPIPQPAFHKTPPYPPFSLPQQYSNGYNEAGLRKRKHEEHPVVAAIDLTVDQREEKRAGFHHQCQCQCGKRYGGEVGTPVTVSQKDNSKVPSYMRGKMVNGVLQFEEGKKICEQNGSVKNEVKGKPTEGRLPPLFLIDHLLSKGVRVPPKSPTVNPNKDKPVPVIVSPKTIIADSIPRPRSKDHTVSTIMGTNRRQSVDIDTISISSSGSDRSPRPKSNIEKQIPHGKLFYYKSDNSFIRYFDDTQKKLFIDNITSDGRNFDTSNSEDKEVIELPKDTLFSCKDSLTVEEYVSEMTLVERYVPRDFFLFYKFVTGYQICHNNLPVSFLTFLKVYNTNGLKMLLDRYVNSLKQN